MALLESIRNELNYTNTENGALALRSTLDPLTDLFAVSGALRERSEEEIESLFARALSEDRLLAARLAFYTRDIRGGLGERRTGRILFRYLAKYYPELFAKNAALISEYGRYDDLVYLVKYAPDIIVPLLKKQLEDDLAHMKKGEPVSLLAKWLPSVNTSSKISSENGKYLAKAFHMSEKKYRRTLSALRKHLNVTECSLSSKNYQSILYPEVPSGAMMKYRRAFHRNDSERFSSYLEKLESGEEKINASTLYPYDIVEKYLYSDIGEDPVLEKQWESLPNYVEGEHRFLVMADVSGSMRGRPMATSVGLALYFAERNKGTFANTFMTFSARPELVTIRGNNLFEKLNSICRADWGMNTDLEAALRTVLFAAINENTPKEEMPDSIVVITDMEIDSCTCGEHLFYDRMKNLYELFGYEIPNIVFWNVNSRKNTYHASFDRKGVQLASGQSPSVFASLAKGIGYTPYEYMCSVLNAERYQAVTV